LAGYLLFGFVWRWAQRRSAPIVDEVTSNYPEQLDEEEPPPKV
jgi:hypothetical protein